MPPWLGAPRGTLPGIVAFERVLAQTDRVAVCVRRLAPYTAGFEFDVVTMTADDQDDLDPLMFDDLHRLQRGAAYELPPGCCASASNSPMARRPPTPAAFIMIVNRLRGR
jgi:hypothetical protein